MYKETYIKTILLIPEESSVQVLLATTSISMVFASLNEEDGYSFAIDGFYLQTASEDSLGWGVNGKSVKLNFYKSKTENAYSSLAKVMGQDFIFINEFLLHNFTHASSLVCGGVIPDAPNMNNSVAIDPQANVVKIACFKDACNNATNFYILIMDSLEFQL
jgi:hypothetical protein